MGDEESMSLKMDSTKLVKEEPGPGVSGGMGRDEEDSSMKTEREVAGAEGDAAALFFERYRFSTVDSGFISSLCLGLAALVSPFLGCLLDRVGRRPDALISGSLLMSGAMFVLLLPSAEMEVFIAVALLGSGFALAPVTLLSSVALVTDEANLAPALGVFKSCENLSMALAHYVAGLLVDVSGGYSWTIMFLKVLCLWAVACALILRRYDRKEGGKLMIVKATAKTGPESQT